LVCHPRHRRLCVAGSAADDEVIGIVDDVRIELVPMAMVVPRQQEASEVAVGQQWGDNSALRGTSLRPSRFSGLNRPTIDDFRLTLLVA